MPLLTLEQRATLEAILALDAIPEENSVTLADLPDFVNEEYIADTTYLIENNVPPPPLGVWLNSFMADVEEKITSLLDALAQCENFVLGFEHDDTQDVADLLETIRAALPPEDAPITLSQRAAKTDVVVVQWNAELLPALKAVVRIAQARASQLASTGHEKLDTDFIDSAIYINEQVAIVRKFLPKE